MLKNLSNFLRRFYLFMHTQLSSVCFEDLRSNYNPFLLSNVYKVAFATSGHQFDSQPETKIKVLLRNESKAKSMRQKPFRNIITALKQKKLLKYISKVGRG